MKKTHVILLGMLVIMLTFGLALLGCNKDLDVTGTWIGEIQGTELIVTITTIGWTSSIPAFGYTDTGSYLRDGNAARLTSDNNGRTIGTVEITDRNTMTLTLNENSVEPGIYSLSRQ